MNLLEFLNNVLIITGSLGAIYSAWSWWKHRRREKALEELVTLQLVSSLDGRPFHTLGIRPQRRSVSRQEVLGLIGMIPTRENRRYSCAYFSTQAFMDQLDAVHAARADILALQFSPAEAEIFLLPTSAS